MHCEQILPAIADHLSTILAEHFFVDPRHPRLVTTASELGIHFYPERGRLHLSGRYPGWGSGWRHYTDTDEPRITVSADREPEAVAKDIARRFWPAYLAEHELAREQYARHVAYTRRREAYRQLLAQAGQGQILPHFESEVDGPHWRAIVGRRVELRLTDIDIETACEVVRLVAGMA